MPVIPSDYDSDPDRWRSCDRNVQVFGDIHSPVARRIVGVWLTKRGCVVYAYKQ